jgi:hypothetical protein
MNKSWFYLGLIGLAILTTSCGDSKPPTPAASPAATPVPAAAVPPTVPAKPVAATPLTPAATTPAATAVKPADASKTAAAKPVSVDVAAGLIAPTDGESWAKTVAKGRPDPFGMLALQPVEIIEPIDPLALKQPVAKIAPLTPIATAKQPVVKIATNNSEPVVKSVATKPSTSKIAAIPAKTAKVASTKKIASKGKDQQVGISSIPRTGVNVALPKIIVALKEPVIAKVKTGAKSFSNNRIAAKPGQNTTSKVAGKTALPTKNQIAATATKVAEKPLQAMAIDISGIIEVEGRTQVIIKLPTESFSRYISVGERIGNGKVLVKRVEGQSSLSPTVILEEVGVEVSRKIGDISTATPAPSEPVAAPAIPVTPAIPATPATKAP